MTHYLGQGHWEGPKLNSKTHFGFVYLITNNVTGRMYVGKKQYYSYVKKKKNKELDWKNYTGSSKDLNKDIKLLGIENFTFKVIKQYKSRGWLSYGEANYQHKKDVLTKWLDDDTRLYYNKQIGPTRFVPMKKDRLL